MSTQTDQQRELARKLAAKIIKALACVVLLMVLFVLGSFSHKNLLFICLGLCGAGALVGFLYSSFGQEKERFSPAFAAANGLIGGATLTDLVGKPETSFLIRIYHTLGNAAELPPDQHGVVLGLAATFGSIGFFAVYFWRVMDANAVQYDAQQIYEKAKAVMAEVTVQNTEETDPGLRSSEIRSNAEQLVAREGAGEEGSFDDLLNDAKAFYSIGQHQQALDALDRCLKSRPQNPDALLFKAGALVGIGKHEQAAEILEILVRQPHTPADAWKLLGFVLLHYPESKPDYKAKLWRSVSASGAFLKAFPNDQYALLNLVCAYGQLGPETQLVVAKFREKMERLVRDYPDLKPRVIELTGPGQDFAGWINHPEHGKWLQPLLGQ